MTQVTTPGRVLILDGDMTPALTVLRSLSRQGLHADIASHDRDPIAGFSRYAKAKLTYPNPLTSESDFIAWLKSVLQRGDYDLIIPVTERTLIPAQQLQDQPGAKKLAMAPGQAIEVALDKSRTLALAKSLDIPIPKSQQVDSIEQIDELQPELRFPVVIKPSRSIGENTTGRQQLQVDYAYNDQELSHKIKHFLHFGPVLLQEYVPGDGVGIELIADNGEIRYAFEHLRLHEVPLSGGGSSLRVSVPVEPALLEASKKLMRALNWHGVAMVEFKRNSADSSFALMEINGRFWGSLPLAVAAGADFPAMLYELVCQGKIQNRPPPATGTYGRKLSSDIYWYEQIVRRDIPPGFKDIPTKKTTLRDLSRIFSPHHHFDVQQWRDPVPGLIDLGRIIRSYANRVSNLIQERQALKRQRNAWRKGRVQSKLGNTRQLLFLCYGNINRSALAERYFNSVAPNSKVQVISAGFHIEEGRPADPVMVSAAGDKEIDMTNWSSIHVTPEMIDASDIILVMEQQHYERIAKDFPDASHKTFLLGMAAENTVPSGEIADPYGRPRNAYEECIKQITVSVDKIAKLVETP